MNKIELDKLPTAPVISSQLSANEQTYRWFNANDFRQMLDRDGQVWQVLMKRSEKPNPDNIHQLIWLASIQLKIQVDAQSLLDHKVLNSEGNHRILELMDGHKILMSMKPKLIRGKNQEMLKREVNEYLPRLKENFRSMEIRAIKRELIADWVERQSWFGGGLL